LPPPLASRPEARAFQVDHLLRLVTEGRIRIPEFQRGLKWLNQDRLKLFDSILRGYPVGTLLLWKREGVAGAVRVGRHQVNAPHRHDALSVVDGQQRIATLTEALIPLDPNKRSIHFDLNEQRFVYERTAGDDPRYLPVGIAIDGARLVEWLVRHSSLPTDSRARAVEAGKSLREYQVPAYVVETDEEDTLREIFHRTNRTGRELLEAEVFNALFRAKAKHQPGDLAALARVPVELGFGTIDEAEALNIVLAVAGLPLDRDFTERMDAALAAEVLPKAAAALRQAVTFLQTDAKVPVYALLPYALPLVVLSKFFHEFPEPHPRSRLLLRRWFWRGALAGTLTGATIGMRKHLESVKPGLEEDSVQRLLALAGPEPDEPIKLVPFQFGTARSKLQCCVLASKRPLSLVDGKLVDFRELFDSDADEKVMRFVPRRAGNGDASRGLANRLLHPLMPTKKLRAAAAKASEPALESHGVSPRAHSALLAGKLDEFFRLRSATLTNWIDAYFKRQAEWRASDHPSIASLRIEEA
jgi:Protein of unknown function DUF262